MTRDENLDMEHVYPSSTVELQFRGIRLDVALLACGLPGAIAFVILAFMPALPWWPAIAVSGGCLLSYAISQYGHDTDYLRRKLVYWTGGRKLCCFRPPKDATPFPVDRMKL